MCVCVCGQKGTLVTHPHRLAQAGAAAIPQQRGTAAAFEAAYRVSGEERCSEHAHISQLHRRRQRYQGAVHGCCCEHDAGVHCPAHDTPEWVP